MPKKTTDARRNDDGNEGNDQREWRYACSAYYQTHTEATTCFEILRTEIVELIPATRRYERTHPFPAVSNSLDVELNRIAHAVGKPKSRSGEQYRANQRVLAQCQEQLYELGLVLMKKGVPMDGLLEILSAAKARLVVGVSEAIKVYREPAALHRHISRAADKRNIDAILACKSEVSTALKYATPHTMEQWIKAAIEPKYGYYGTLEAYRQVGKVKAKDADSILARLKKIWTVGDDALIIAIRKVLDESGLAPERQLFIELVNCLAVNQIFRTSKDPITHKSVGEEALRKRINRLTPPDAKMQGAK
ncbi:MAG: hypothetical protein WAU88_11660 [Candidatus Zixiibacteriota bacterium]